MTDSRPLAEAEPRGFRASVLQDWHRYSPGPPTWKAVLGALIFNAGFLAVFLFRLSQRLKEQGWPVSSRLAWRLNLAVCAVEISPSAVVEPGLYLPHPYCVTIGRGAVVGRNATLFQGVCLGARAVTGEVPTAGSEYPTLEDNVTLYTHVLAYGPITLGHGAMVLGNSVVTSDVPADALYGGIPAGPIQRRVAHYGLKQPGN